VNWRRISGKRRGRRQKTAACRKASNFDAISASETIADRPQSANLLFGSGCARILNFVLYQAQDPVGKTSAIGGGKLFRFLFQVSLDPDVDDFFFGHATTLINVNPDCRQPGDIVNGFLFYLPQPRQDTVHYTVYTNRSPGLDFLPGLIRQRIDT
jgi:hypothetical protein